MLTLLSQTSLNVLATSETTIRSGTGSTTRIQNGTVDKITITTDTTTINTDNVTFSRTGAIPFLFQSNV